MRKRILIVDDEMEIRQMLCVALSQENYECMEAADTIQAQEKILEVIPDMLLIEWMSPGLSGVEYARFLRGEKFVLGDLRFDFDREGFGNCRSFFEERGDQVNGLIRMPLANVPSPARMK